MKKEVVIIPGVKNSDSPFNHVVKAGNFLFLTSQLSADLKTGEIIQGDIGEQTKHALENIKTLLESCGTTMDNILKAVVYLRNLDDFEKMNNIYSQYFTKGLEPARVTIQAPSPIKSVDIEIEVTALIER
jgi:2-iminobutanoate/2-iminopropanoate deaminase